MLGLAVLLVWLVLGAVSIGWLRWTWERRRELPRAALALAFALGAGTSIGVLGSITGLIRAFGAIGGESVDPSQRAYILAGGISQAINCTALGALIALPAAVALWWTARHDGPRRP